MKALDQNNRQKWIAVALVALMAAVFILLAVLQRRSPIKVNVSMNTNGMTRIGMIPLPGAFLRDKTFAVMGTLGVNVSVRMPDTSNDSALETNVIETLNSMGRAGLFSRSTNPPAIPYE